MNAETLKGVLVVSRNPRADEDGVMPTVKEKLKKELQDVIPAQINHRLSPETLQLIRVLRHPKINVFGDVHREKLNTDNGLIVVMCSDCDRAFDSLFFVAGLYASRHNLVGRVFSWFKRLIMVLCWAYLRIHPRIHIFAWHGGPYRLVADSPMNKMGRAEHFTFRDEIIEAIALRHIYTIVLLGHCECGKAKKHEVGLEQATKDLMEVRKNILREYERLREQKTTDLARASSVPNPNELVPTIEVACITQVDYGKNEWWRRIRRRSYHTDAANWTRFLKLRSGKVAADRETQELLSTLFR